MTKRKPRLEKSRTPQKFSVHLSKSNLEKIKDIQDQYEMNTRNEAINRVIEDYWHYILYMPLITALRNLGVGS